MTIQGSAGRFETHDIEQQGSAADPWDVVHRQMSCGQFQASTECVQVNGILCYRQHWTKRTLVQGVSPAGFLTIGCSYTPSSHIQWCGSELNTQRFALAESSSEVEFVIPDDSDHWGILIPYDLLLPYLDHEFQENRRLENNHHLVCDPALGSVINALIPSIIKKYVARSELLNQEQECKALESKLLEVVRQVAGSGAVERRTVSQDRRNKIFRHAIDYVESATSLLPLSVPELANAIGVSQRVLEMVFKEKLGMTPNRFLRLLQMNSTHRDLLSFSGEIPSPITEIATHHGFTQMGRFAVEYKQLFGESPSQTLARKASVPLVSLASIMRA